MSLKFTLLKNYIDVQVGDSLFCHYSALLFHYYNHPKFTAKDEDILYIIQY